MIQHKRFLKLGKQLKKSPFYHKVAVTKYSLYDFPVINKEVFMKNFDRINTLGIKKDEALRLAMDAEENRDFSDTLNGITVGLSTGTSGNKGIFLASEKERALWVAAMLHRVIGFQFKKRKIAFFLRANSKLYESANSSLIQFNFFDLLNPHHENFDKLVELKPDILVAQPSLLLQLAKSFSKQNITPGFKKVISVAEVLNLSDKYYLENIFGIKLDEVYQCTEGFLASTCSLGNLHFNEDFLIIEKEYIDREKIRFNPVITDLYRHTQPVIRYKLDDILTEGAECGCGSHFTVIQQIEGRMDDVIILKDKVGNPVTIYPDYFRRAITSSSDEINDYELTQTGEASLEIFIGSVPAELNKSIQIKVYENLLHLLSKFNIEKISILFIHHSNQDKGTKLRRIKNDYRKRL